MRKTSFTTIAVTALLAAGVRSGFAFGGGHRMGGPPFMGGGALPLPVLISVMTPAQRQTLRDTLQTDRTTMRSLVEQLRSAQQELTTRMLAPGTLAASDLHLDCFHVPHSP